MFLYLKFSDLNKLNWYKDCIIQPKCKDKIPPPFIYCYDELSFWQIESGLIQESINMKHYVVEEFLEKKNI